MMTLIGGYLDLELTRMDGVRHIFLPHHYFSSSLSLLITVCPIGEWLDYRTQGLSI